MYCSLDVLRDTDGRFLSTLPDKTNILYLTVDGDEVCASCLNMMAKHTDFFTTTDKLWHIREDEVFQVNDFAFCTCCGKKVA